MLPGICAQLKPQSFPNEYPGLSNGVALSGAPALPSANKRDGVDDAEGPFRANVLGPKVFPKDMARNTHIRLSF